MPPRGDREREPLSALVSDRPGGHLELRQREGETYLVLRNEFATVWLGVSETPSGVRILVTDPETQTSIALDPLELEAVSRMTHRDFDELILERWPDEDAAAADLGL